MSWSWKPARPNVARCPACRWWPASTEHLRAEAEPGEIGRGAGYAAHRRPNLAADRLKADRTQPYAVVVDGENVLLRLAQMHPQAVDLLVKLRRNLKVPAAVLLTQAETP